MIKLTKTQLAWLTSRGGLTIGDVLVDKNKRYYVLMWSGGSHKYVPVYLPDQGNW
jgi:hypothetical protein